MLKDILFRESIPTLQQGLDAASLRQKVIADNIANVATPGYQARHVRFEELLQGRMPPHQLQLSATSDGRTLTLKGPEAVRPQVELDTSAALKSGVNNVDVENEMAQIQKNSLLHSAMVQLISNKYKMLDKAIVDR